MFVMRYLLATCISLCLAVSATGSKHVVHERRDLESGFWLQRRVADKELVVQARIALKPRNVDLGHGWLMDVSDPYSSNYGKHYTAEEVVELFEPDKETIGNVLTWLHEKNFRNITLSGNKQWLSFMTNIGSLQDLLLTDYYEFEHPKSGKLSVGCNHYSVPSHLKKHIEFISPGLTMAETLSRTPNGAKGKVKHLMRARKASTGGGSSNLLPRVDAANTSDCNSLITPQCVKELYNITDKVFHNATDGNGIGVYQSSGDFLNPNDLNQFFEMYAPEIPQGTYPQVQTVDGAPDPRVASQEFTLIESENDFEAIYPLVYPIPVELFQVDDEHYEGAKSTPGLFNTFLDYLDGSYCNKSAFGITGDIAPYDAIYPDNATNPFFPSWNHPVQCGITKPPRVISISYSASEYMLSAPYARRQCQEFLKLGLQGVSIFGSSGDSGVADNNGHCIGGGDNEGPFAPFALTNCPYVTAVGATALPQGGTAGETPEVAANTFHSSGGFSNVFMAPPYQANALQAYFQNRTLPYQSYETVNNPTAANVTGRYNRIGRGIPDVAAIGQNTITIASGIAQTPGGTSISAPFWAGIVARINGARAAIGKGGVGFLNPVLYAHSEVFNDVVKGNNPGCGTQGFPTAPGWDPVTGLGTPNYPKLKKLLLSL